MTVRTFALTYPQLMNQALHQNGAGQALVQGWDEAALSRLRHAYECAEEWFDGFYRGQGEPFICHLVRTASIVLAEGGTVETTCASLLHSAYMLGRFHNDRLERATETERPILRRAIGKEIEQAVWDFHHFPWYCKEALDGHLARFDSYGQKEHRLLVIRLANELEDHLDLNMVYRGTRSFQEEIEEYSPRCVALAKRLGRMQLAGELEKVFTAHREARIPEALQTKKHFSYKWPDGKMKKLDFDSDQIFYEWEPTEGDQELIRLAEVCLKRQKGIQPELLSSRFKPNPKAKEAVSKEALAEILRSGSNVEGISQERHISNVIIFNVEGVDDIVQNRELLELRGKLDKAVFRRLSELFATKKELHMFNTGHFWYPKGGYMGWHTNMGLPGWRLYINHTEEPGKSFIRYRDPATGEIITSWDRTWHLRIFRIDPQRPFWHAIYSETDRYSFGYNIVPVETPSLPSRVVRKAKQLLERVGAV